MSPLDGSSLMILLASMTYFNYERGFAIRMNSLIYLFPLGEPTILASKPACRLVRRSW